jgi:2'-5' RNA ligase
MIALMPTAEHAARLAVPGGEPADQLHITLRYLGDVDEIPTGAPEAILTACRALFAGESPVEVDLFGAAVFAPDEPDDACVVLLASGADLDRCRRLAVSAAAGRVVVEEHLPYVAHLTIACSPQAALMVPGYAGLVGPLLCDRVRVAVGDTYTDIPLGGPDA